MSLAAVAPGAGRTAITRRNIIVAVLLALAAAGGLFIASRPDLVKSVANRFGSAVTQGVKDGVQGFKTVAAMMAERSPGERAKGALASLKHKRITELHERALPKVRRPGAATPVSPLAAIVAGPPVPPVVPPTAPVFTAMTAPPVPIPSVGAIPVGGGGPPIIEAPPPGGGGGIIPPVPTTPGTPTTPPETPSAVPEPGTWALMLLGFGFVGFAVRRDRRRTGLASAG